MDTGLRPRRDFLLSGRLGIVILFALSAATTALIAHIGIDVLGDYLLPHDAYDDVAHGSRNVVTGAALAIVSAAGLRFFFAILDRAGTRAFTIPARVARQSALVYLGLVVAAALGILAAMGMADLAFAGRPRGDFDDLLGGSLPLAAGVTTTIACIVAFSLWRLTAWAHLAHLAAVRIVTAFVIVRPRHNNVRPIRTRGRVRPFTYQPQLARSTNRRGPPANPR